MEKSGSPLVDVSHTLGHKDTKVMMRIYDKMTNKRSKNVSQILSNYTQNSVAVFSIKVYRRFVHSQSVKVAVQ